MKPEQDTEDAADYASREQELLAYLREAERASTSGDIGGMLKMQAKVHNSLISIIGNQTQRAFRVAYSPRH